jgi:hypothetical protein
MILMQINLMVLPANENLILKNTTLDILSVTPFKIILKAVR